MTATSQFALTQDQQNLIDLADRFARQEMYPLAPKMDDEEWWPPHIFRKFCEGGFLGVTLPETYGGAGMSLLDAGLILQAFSRWNHALALSWVAHDNLCANNLHNNGSKFICSKYLPKMCSGEWIGCLGLTEPGAGAATVQCPGPADAFSEGLGGGLAKPEVRRRLANANRDDGRQPVLVGGFSAGAA